MESYVTALARASTKRTSRTAESRVVMSCPAGAPESICQAENLEFSTLPHCCSSEQQCLLDVAIPGNKQCCESIRTMTPTLTWAFRRSWF